jgi:enoyl-CoA hydratase
VSEAPHLLTEVTDDGILIATLNRPDKLNALSDETMALFEDAVLRFRDTDGIKVMMIRATGRYFCAGADLKQGDGKGFGPTARSIREGHRVGAGNRNMQGIYDEMEHIEKPIVVAHHGMCVGGGLEMSLSCDFRLAAKSAGYAFPEGLFGVLPASNGVSRLTRICGPHWARWLIMANKRADADMAYAMGLVHKVWPDDEFEDNVMAFCRHLAKQNEEQMGGAKVAIEIARETGRDTARDVERMMNSALMLNADYLTRMDEYTSKIGGGMKQAPEPEEPHLLTREQDGIMVCTLNRPDKLNAMSDEMFQLFEAALHRFRDTDELKVMLLNANGRYFTAGADLKSGDALERPTTARGIREMHRVRQRGVHRIHDEMERIEKPIVAAHHATCVGGGIEISLCCDFRLAAESATYVFPEGLFGVVPASSGLSRMTRICGTHWARWLIMGNERADARMALNMGLVHQVFPDESFEQEVWDFCLHLAKQNEEQMGAAKVAIELCAEVARDSGRHVERLGNSALMLNPEYQAGIAEYLKGVGGKS